MQRAESGNSAPRRYIGYSSSVPHMRVPLGIFFEKKHRINRRNAASLLSQVLVSCELSLPSCGVIYPAPFSVADGNCTVGLPCSNSHDLYSRTFAVTLELERSSTGRKRAAKPGRDIATASLWVETMNTSSRLRIAPQELHLQNSI